MRFHLSVLMSPVMPANIPRAFDRNNHPAARSRESGTESAG